MTTQKAQTNVRERFAARRVKDIGEAPCHARYDVMKDAIRLARTRARRNTPGSRRYPSDLSCSVLKDPPPAPVTLARCSALSSDAVVQDEHTLNVQGDRLGERRISAGQ